MTMMMTTTTAPHISHFFIWSLPPADEAGFGGDIGAAPGVSGAGGGAGASGAGAAGGVCVGGVCGSINSLELIYMLILTRLRFKQSELS